MTDTDPLSVRVRLLEATEHLERARESLAERDEAAAGRLDAAISDIDALGPLVEQSGDHARWQDGEVT